MAAVQTAAQAAHPGAGGGPRPLVILGAGEHARVVADAAATRSDQWRVIGYTIAASEDPATHALPDELGIPGLGTDEDLASRLESGGPTWLVLGFGRPAAARRMAADRFGPAARWATIVHAAATVSPGASVAGGAVILAGAIVNTGASIGPHAIVNSGAIVEHDVVVGAHAQIAPGAVIGGGATIGDDAVIGLGAVVRDHVTIGARAIVGMGSAVVDDVPDDTVVTGVPARPQAARTAGPDRG